jgi:hypothetical protein
MAITGPKGYYEKMGFLGVDQMIYTVALLGMAAGTIGTAKAVWMKREFFNSSIQTSWLPFLALTVGSTWAAATGLKQANDSN